MLKHVFIAGNMAFISLGGLHVSQVFFFFTFTITELEFHLII